MKWLTLESPIETCNKFYCLLYISKKSIGTMGGGIYVADTFLHTALGVVRGTQRIPNCTR
jgi:hypothetical protein